MTAKGAWLSLAGVGEIDRLFLSNQMPDIAAGIEAMSSSERVSLAQRLVAAIEGSGYELLERVSAGNTLGLLGDPRIDRDEPRMCRVPAGSFLMGTRPQETAELAARYGIPEAWMRKSSPQQEVQLDSFEIARFPVTEGEYHAFVLDSGYSRVPLHWIDLAPPPYRSNHPVQGTGWEGALLYVEWMSERSGRRYRVPTEAEWEKAARGTDARAFPWGDRFDPGRCNTREGGIGQTTPVGVYPAGVAPCGALDMAGNVEEYTADLYWPYPGSDFQDPEFGTYRMTRGGVWALDADLARCDRRHGEAYASAVGFRLARSASDDWSGEPD